MKLRSQGGIKGKEAEKLQKIERDGAGSSHWDWPRQEEEELGEKGQMGKVLN